MKNFIYLFIAVTIFSCSSDSDGNSCVYEPTLTTQAATDITETSVTLNGVISIVSENCEVPNNTEQGFVYSTEIQPTLGNTQVSVIGTNISTTIEELTPNTTYYVRAFLTNTFGDFYGDEIDFMTAELSLVNCDGNPIPSIVYGSQEWTVENACHITYRDGTPIPEVTDDTEWKNLTTGAWSYYENDATKPRLYNWYAVMGIHDAASLSDVSLRKEFTPEGWHVPSDTDWTTLEEHLIANGYNYDGTTTENKIGKAMVSTTGWFSSAQVGAVGNVQSSNNSSGFNAFPEGFRYNSGSFSDEGYSALFWSFTETSTNYAWYRLLSLNDSYLYRNANAKQLGFSVRFVRD